MQITLPNEYFPYCQEHLAGREPIGMSLGDLSDISRGLPFRTCAPIKQLNSWKIKDMGHKIRFDYPELGWDDAREITVPTYTGPVSACNLGLVFKGDKSWMFHLLYDRHGNVSDVPYRLLLTLAQEGEYNGFVSGGLETFVSMHEVYYRLGLVLIHGVEKIIADPV